jgi:hypothetical protein
MQAYCVARDAPVKEPLLKEETVFLVNKATFGKYAGICVRGRCFLRTPDNLFSGITNSFI